jgi:tetratricopeptide (TPR) repeat protein
MRRFCARLALIILFATCGPRAQQHASASGQAQAVAPSVPPEISAKDAAALEAGLTANPNNFAARQALIHYYFLETISSPSSDLQEKRDNHVFWLIEHHPESPLAGSPEAGIMPGIDSTEQYQRGKQLWLQQVENRPDNVSVLRNAAQFLTAMDGKIARDLLEKAEALDPGNAQTSSALAQAYELERMQVRSPDDKAALAKKALSLRESSLETTDNAQRFYELGDLAKSALESGELNKAQQYASELLQMAPKFNDNWNYGNAVHHGNNILGLVALQRGDISGAKEHLLAAGKTPGSPQLDSFGPNMTLAKELFEKGERDTVLTYLQSCSKFWKMGGDSLQAWIATINGGGTPDFGANLDY